MTSTRPTIWKEIVSVLCAVFLVGGVVAVPLKAEAADGAASRPTESRLSGARRSDSATSGATERAKSTLSGIACESQKFCIYDQAGFKSGIGSLTIIPRFYHMAIDCYVQAAIIGTKRYYDMTARPGKPFSEAETGFGGEWKLASFCTEEVKDKTGVVFNAHVIANTRLLYVPQTLATSPVENPQETEEGNAIREDSALQRITEIISPGVQTQTKRLVNQKTVSTGTASLHVLLEQYDARLKKSAADRAKSSTMDSPERLVSDILWKEYLSYAQYLTTLKRDPSEVARAEEWSKRKAFQSIGSGIWTAFLRDQIESVGRADAGFDARVARATRDVADTMYGEFVRTYSEHLQYIIMRDNLRDIAVQLDSFERALSTLGVKLKDAFVTGN